MAKVDIRSILTADERASMDAAYRAAFIDYVDKLTDVLNDNLVDLFDYLVGESRTNRSARQARWRGNSGNNSVSLELTGRKRGVWYDFGAGVGGRPIQAIKHFLAKDFMSAMEFAADRYGYPRFDTSAVRRESADKLAAERAERERKRAERDAIAREEDAKNLAADIRAARYFWDNAVAIERTLGEVYLRQTREIYEVRASLLQPAWPKSVRWNEREQALVFAVTDGLGQVVAVQLVAVAPDGTQDKTRYGKASKKPTGKKSRGPIAMGSVKFPSFKSDTAVVLFAEGPETGLTVWLATGYETRVTLGVGGFKRAVNEAPKNKRIVLCRDDDSTDKQSYKAAVAGLFTLANSGFDVWDVWPFDERRQDGSDFNDTLKEFGLDAVSERIEVALCEQLKFDRIEHSLAAAERLVDRRVGEFFTLTTQYQDGQPQIVCALGVDTGVGKTHAAISHVIQFVLALRERGDTRCVVIAVPEHKLSREVAERIRREVARVGAGLNVEIWRGREALKPNAKDADDKMCDDVETVRLAGELCADVEKEVCGACHFGQAGVCQYQAQRALSADIWVGAHQMIFREPPQPISRAGIAALIVDEDMADAGIRAPFTMPIDAIERMPLPKDEDGRLTLMDFRHRLATILDKAPEGFLRRDALRQTDFDIDYTMASAAIEQEWARKVTPKQERDFRKREANRTLNKAVSMAKATADLAMFGGPEVSGCISLGHDKDGAKVVHISHKATVHETWLVPTLVMDAMHYDTDVLKFFWPTVRDFGRVNVATPHQTIRQVVNKSYSIKSLAPAKKKSASKDDEAGLFEPGDNDFATLSQDDRAKAAKNNRRDVAAAVYRLHRNNGGKTLLVGNKDVVTAPEFKALASMSPKDAAIEVAWYGAMAGRDEWKDVRTLIVLGRPLPSPRAVETMAATLTGAGVETLKRDQDSRRSGWYERCRTYREKRVGRNVVRVPAETDSHPDAMVERLRWQECVGGIMQAIGRGRGTRRTADTPLDVVVMTDVVLPVPVHEFLLAEDLEPTLADLQLAAGGVAFETGSCASAAYPSLWASPDAFRSALKRVNERESGAIVNRPLPNNSVSFSYIYSYTGMTRCSGQTARLHTVEFQLSGPKQHRQTATYDAAIIAEPRAAIEALVGPVEWLVVVGSPEAIAEPITVPPPVAVASIGRAGGAAIVVAVADMVEASDTCSVIAVVEPAIEPTIEADIEPDIEPAPDIDWPRVETLLRDGGQTFGQLAERLEVSSFHLSNIKSGRRRATQKIAAGVQAFLRDTVPAQQRLF